MVENNLSVKLTQAEYTGLKLAYEVVKLRRDNEKLNRSIVDDEKDAGTKESA